MNVGDLSYFSNRDYNYRMLIECRLLSDKNINHLVNKYHWEGFYPLLSNALNNRKTKKKQLKCAEVLLNTAPCDGPFCHNEGDIGKLGWASSFRFSENQNTQLNGGSEVNRGNYNGLDYMILHNLYFLSAKKNKKKALPNYFVEIVTQSLCVENPAQYCKNKKKNCKKAVQQECKEIKDDCKESAEDEFDKCKDKCSTKKCKKKCKKEKRQAKRKCRKNKRECKREGKKRCRNSSES